MPFNQNVWNVFCSDLNAVRLSRAAAASSAVPVVLSTITINNYGGTCNYELPGLGQAVRPKRRIRRGPPHARYAKLQDVLPYADGAHRPYIHLVDGGVSDNLGMRGVLDALEFLEALHDKGLPTPLDQARRIVVFVVNSLSDPAHQLGRIGEPARHDRHPAEGHRRADRSLFLRGGRAAERHRGAVADGAGAPEAGRVFDQQGLAGLRGDTSSGSGDLRHRRVVRHASRRKERDYLNLQPTSFVLPPEAVDRLRAAAGTIILASPEFQRLLKDVGAKSRCRSIRQRESRQPAPSQRNLQPRNSPPSPMLADRRSEIALSVRASHTTQHSETR